MREFTNPMPPEPSKAGQFLVLNQVEKSYGSGDSTHIVLRSVSLNVDKGERVALLGQSGSGKSTLLNVVSGIDTIAGGEIIIDGVRLHALAENERTLFRRRHIGFIYQSFNLIQTLTALENVALPLQLNRFDPQLAETSAQQMLQRVGLSDRVNAFPDQLSGGEQQRVAIARAMVHKPALVLADEHTGNLDAETGGQMMALFNDIARETNQTVLMVTHSRAVAKTAGRIVQMVDGGVVEGESSQSQSLAW